MSAIRSVCGEIRFLFSASGLFRNTLVLRHSECNCDRMCWLSLPVVAVLWHWRMPQPPQLEPQEIGVRRVRLRSRRPTLTVLAPRSREASLVVCVLRAVLGTRLGVRPLGGISPAPQGFHRVSGARRNLSCSTIYPGPGPGGLLVLIPQGTSLQFRQRASNRENRWMCPLIAAFQ